VVVTESLTNHPHDKSVRIREDETVLMVLMSSMLVAFAYWLSPLAHDRSR